MSFAQTGCLSGISLLRLNCIMGAVSLAEEKEKECPNIHLNMTKEVFIYGTCQFIQAIITKIVYIFI